MITREIQCNETSMEVSIDSDRKTAVIGEKDYPYHWINVGNGVYHMRTGTRNYRVHVIAFEPPDQLLFQVNGRLWQVTVRDEQQQLLKKMGFESAENTGIYELKAPMPGRVLDIPVTEGTEISADQPLVILEAMKMENELRSPHAGRIESINVKSGESVEKHQLLITLKRN